jgi:hypothetical protein
MFKDAYEEAAKVACVWNGKPNQNNQKMEQSPQTYESKVLRWNVNLPKLLKKSEDIYMKVLLEDLSRLDRLLSSQDSPKTPLSKDGDFFSCGSQLRRLSKLTINAADLHAHSSSLSSEGTGKSRINCIEQPNEKIGFKQSEELEYSLSMESYQDITSKEAFTWKEMKDSYKNNPKKPSLGIEFFKDDTFMGREEKEEEFFATPKNLLISNFHQEFQPRPHINSFSLACNNLQKTSSERKTQISFLTEESSIFHRSKNLKLKDEEQCRIITQEICQPEGSFKLQEPIKEIKKKCSLIERRKLKALPLETKFASSQPLESLHTSHKFYSLLRPATWQVNSLGFLASSLSGPQPFRVALCPVTSPHVLGLAHSLNARRPDLAINCIVPWPHLFFNCHKIAKGDTRFKADQPVGSKLVQTTLLEHLKAGTITAVASCHMFVAKEFKKIGSGSFFRAVSGIILSLGMNCAGYHLHVLWTQLLLQEIKKKSLKNFDFSKQSLEDLLPNPFSVLASLVAIDSSSRV